MSDNPTKSCEVCGNASLVPVIDLGLHPMCDDLVEIGSDRRCHEYPIEILFCDVCRTAHQRYQVPKEQLFPKSYHYRSRLTADVLNGMRNLVTACQTRFGDLNGKLVVDIGCNDGSLLDLFRNTGALTVGVEPTAASEDARRQNHVVYNDFLSDSLAMEIRDAHGAPDFIVFTNVFAHIENLPEVIRCVEMMKGPNTAIVIENHYLGAILKYNQFDTFYHEHPRTYSLSSFIRIAKSMGVSLSGVEFPSRYGGNIRVFLGGSTVQRQDFAEYADTTLKESTFLDQFGVLRSNLARWKARKRQVIEALVEQHGRISAKAFPGRAAILIKLLGLDENTVSAVHEKPGSMKLGHYVPGTRIPILSDEELFAKRDKLEPLLNLAWHISEEIKSYLLDHGYRGEVMDIVDAKDFVCPEESN